MSDIEWVIKIPEGLKNDFESEQWTALSCMEMKDALEKAKPLPKGHDRLVEAHAVVKALFNHKTIDDVPTIIEADKTESEKT